LKVSMTSWYFEFRRIDGAYDGFFEEINDDKFESAGIKDALS